MTSVFQWTLALNRPGSPSAHLSLDQWIVDVLAWLLCLIESFIRDAWVLFAKLDRRVKAKRTNHGYSASLEHEDSLEVTCRLLRAANQDGSWPLGAVQTCFRWLKPPAAVPPDKLLIENRWLSAEDSHTAWKQQLYLQGQWPQYDASHHHEVSERVKHLLGHARAHKGQGLHDHAFLQPESFRAAEAITLSPAPSPFLIPRCLLTLKPNAWHDAACKLQEVCGPNSLCLRPMLWRFRSLVVKHKKGPCSSPSSYRFLAMADIHGLIQEQLLLGRIAPLLHRSLEWFQTGYRFDVKNHHFTLSSLQAEYQHWNRCFIAIFADFVHAFPRGWRAAIVEQCHDCAGLKDGALALLGSIMDSDYWRITLSGDSVVSTREGIPEGSKYGPTCFNMLPNTLVKALLHAKCGVPLSACAPAAWRGHFWTGRGSPEPEVVEGLVAHLNHGGPLPNCDLLAKDCNLEAACARALDLVSDMRIPVLLHADDPVLLASSRGEANRVLSIVSTWASKYKATLHLGHNKTAAMVLPVRSRAAGAPLLPLRYLPVGHCLPHSISWTSSHKWLGMLWNDKADFALHARQSCGMCNSTVQALCGLLRSGRIPLAVAWLRHL